MPNGLLTKPSLRTEEPTEERDWPGGSRRPTLGDQGPPDCG